MNFSRLYECRLCMDLPEANSTTVRDLYCEQPALVCHGPQLLCVRRLRSSGFLHADAALWAVALHRRDSELGILHARRVFMKYLNTLI